MDRARNSLWIGDQSATTQFASGILWRVTIKIACLLSCLARHSEASNAFGFQATRLFPMRLPRDPDGSRNTDTFGAGNDNHRSPARNPTNSTAVDLTLDPIIKEFKKLESGIETVIDPVNANFRDEEVLESITVQKIIVSEGYVLHPQKFVLGWTAEYIDLKIDTRLAARVEGKSSIARLGIVVHMTAPTIHAGFEGQIRLEIANYGLFPVRFAPQDENMPTGVRNHSWRTRKSVSIAIRTANEFSSRKRCRITIRRFPKDRTVRVSRP